MPRPLPGLGQDPLYSSDAKYDRPATEVDIVPYWSEVFAADLASVTVAIAGLKYGQELHWIGLGGALLGPSAIHLLHGHKGDALISAGARAGLPVVGGLAGGLIGIVGVGGVMVFNTASSEEDVEDSIRTATIALTLVGAGAGAVAGMIVSYLGEKEASPVIDFRGRAQARGWIPMVSPTRGGASVGIAGSF